MTYYGDIRHSNQCSCPKQVLEVMVFAHYEDSADLCATDVKEIAYTRTIKRVLHHENRCISYQYSYMLVESSTIPLWPNNDRQAELVSKELSYADSTECIERKLITLLLEAVGFACNEDNADLSYTHVKGIAHHSSVKFVLSHQESRCIYYQYFTHVWRKNNNFVMLQ